MTFTTAIFLGVLQGLTEFLPISSDGHLTVASLFLDLPAENKDQLGFDVMLHAGSFLALLLCYARTWLRLTSSLWEKRREDQRLLFLLVIGTIPAVIAGLFLEDAVATTFRTLTMAAVGFLVTAVVLITGEVIGRRARESSHISLPHAILIGLAQAIAILPGVSRSGLTISMGRLLGLPRRNALDFSFLLATPVIGGAVALIGLQVAQGAVTLPSFSLVAAGFVASFLTSVLAIIGLLRFVRRYSLAWFSLYLIPLALFLLTRS